MESESNLSMIRRRTSDMLQSARDGVPAMPAMSAMPSKMPQLPAMPQWPSWKLGKGKEATMTGTWEPISLPPLPRSSHTVNVISGSAYIFGGEINPREPVDNDMHVVTLPWGSAGSDYFKVKAVAQELDEPEAQFEAKTEDRNSTPASQAGSDAEEKDANDEKDMDEVSLKDEDAVSSASASTESKGKEKEPPASEVKETADANVPAPRVGHATATIGSRIFMFGGRGGPDMKPLDEAGRVWVFDTRSHTWSHLDPVPAVKGGTIIPHPSARSYHCATATDRPRDFAKPIPPPPRNWRERIVGDTSKTGIPQNPIVGNVAEEAVDEESDGYGTFLIHGGCLKNGERTSDIWAFDVHTRTWRPFLSAPGPARGGTAICISQSRLFRFGGYDGEKELGGQIDFLHLEVEMFDDKVSRGEVAIRPRGSWQSILQDNLAASPTEIPVELSQQWPSARSVSSLHALTTGGGREYLVVAMGEGAPSSDGHEGAGKFHGDVWAFQVPQLGMSAASLTDAMWQAMGRKTGGGKWQRVVTMPYDEDTFEEPQPRGWLASAVIEDLGESAIFIWGGLNEQNERLGDGWILRLD
ncbi:Kelch motif [Geosmithia morbida]|uniref:Kelch motif n=1 Tax=Geosmithia morbida TaxID=1094350 RepID=A0A9P5D1U7_9HYPO|nr:Kelch motif [Geosmithia morbida]KAF4124323.1 Kelch motif [Geosmithia morbida]